MDSNIFFFFAILLPPFFFFLFSFKFFPFKNFFIGIFQSENCLKRIERNQQDQIAECQILVHFSQKYLRNIQVGFKFLVTVGQILKKNDYKEIKKRIWEGHWRGKKLNWFNWWWNAAHPITFRFTFPGEKVMKVLKLVNFENRKAENAARLTI